VRFFQCTPQSFANPSDRPEILHTKITKVKDELAVSGQHNPHSLQEATAFLQERWESLQQHVNSSASRAKAALESAWRQVVFIDRAHRKLRIQACGFRSRAFTKLRFDQMTHLRGTRDCSTQNRKFKIEN